MQVAALLIDVIKAIATWPVVMFVLGFMFLRRFKNEIGQFLSSITALTWGDKKIDLASQAAKNLTDPPQATPAPAPGTLASITPTAPAVDALVQSERERAQLWEFRYLDEFLVARTQLVLDWLAGHGPILVNTADAWLMPVVPEAHERVAILQALETHHLIEVDRSRDYLISVTDKGRAYMTFRGPAAEFVKLRWPSARTSAYVAPSGRTAPAPEVNRPGNLGGRVL